MTLDLFPETANPRANLLPYDGIVSDFGRIFTAAEADRYFEILQRETFAKKPFLRQPKPKHRFSAVFSPNHS